MGRGEEVEMEELLRTGDYGGLAALCEQEELQVRLIVRVSVILSKDGIEI